MYNYNHKHVLHLQIGPRVSKLKFLSLVQKSLNLDSVLISEGKLFHK